MYDFKHHRNDNERYNTYESYTEVIEPVNIYDNIRNTLFVVALIIIILTTGIISVNKYKEHNNSSSQTLIKNYIQHNEQKDELSHLKLTEAISKSIVHNLQTQRTLQNLDDLELKRIIKRVVHKIEKAPSKITHKQY